MISEEDECTRSDNNAECDDTNTCICRANYVEEFAVCKSEYIDTAYQTFENKIVVSFKFICNMGLIQTFFFSTNELCFG